MSKQGVDIKIRAAVENDAALKALREQEATLKIVASAAKRAGMDTSKLDAETAALGKTASRRELQVQIDALEKMASRSKLAGKENEQLKKSLAGLHALAATPPPLPAAKPGMLAGAGAALSRVPGVGGYLGLGVAGAAAAGVATTVGIIATLTRTMVDGTKAAADFAGGMADLADQTGETAEEAIVLGQAFRNAGLDGMVGQSLNLLQKALTGVNEEGQPTAAVFKRLGLSIEDLKGMRATEQIETISAAISKLRTPADQSRAAMEMFGRSGGRMLAILKDAEAISTARTQVGELGKYINASAKDLDKFSDALGAMDTKQLGFFAGFASGIAGDLGKAADALNKLDFSKQGEQLGFMARGASELAKEMNHILAALPKLPGQKDSLTVGKVAGFGAEVGIKSAFTGMVPGGSFIQQFLGYLGRSGEAAVINEAKLKEKAAPGPEVVTTRPGLGPTLGPGGDLEAIAKAAENYKETLQKKAAADKAAATGTEEADLLEAKASGNKKKVREIEWTRNMQAEIEKGVAPWDAKRIANMKAMDDPAKDLPSAKALSLGVSSAARLGMAVGESSAVNGTLSALQSLLKKQEDADKIAERTAKATEAMAKKRGGYQ